MTIDLTSVAGTIAACLAVSLCSLSSATALRLKPETLKWLVPNLVALAVGMLLGDAFIHLSPDAIQRHGAVSAVCLTVLLGMFVFFVLEKGVRWRHDHNLDSRPTADHILPLAKMNLFGDAMHNFVDGILIAGSFLADPIMGVTTTLAIVAHEIPQELGDVGALPRGGFIYIAASDPIPELHERSNLPHLGGQSAAFASGIVFMQFIVFFEQALLAA
ncbi:ZIP family metal transporter [Methylomonas methanica]|uniref:Zinc/iron permease n=1 Tax=Methylomonas methanica (strain DSM 25384 / MC09) TaxID=857087 RepID=G0A2M4_METMM|nr:ZIP family metal transporter [Methylomonas methanica]AEG00204.1 zinc/iron permease [Methylomonas methanica MC09]